MSVGEIKSNLDIFGFSYRNVAAAEIRCSARIAKPSSFFAAEPRGVTEKFEAEILVKRAESSSVPGSPL
jgi:hypothetical protein